MSFEGGGRMEEEKFALCESIGHRLLRGCCPKTKEGKNKGREGEYWNGLLEYQVILKVALDNIHHYLYSRAIKSFYEQS